MHRTNRSYTAEETAEIVAHAQRTTDSDAAQRFRVPRRTVTGMRAKAEQRGAEYLGTAAGLDQARQAAHEYAKDDKLWGGAFHPFQRPPVAPPGEHVAPSFPDLKVPEIDLDELFDAVEKMQDIREKADAGQRDATIELATDQPVVVNISGDDHLFSLGTDHRQWRLDAKYVLETDFLYRLSLADEIDNFVSFKSMEPVHNQLAPPHLQHLALDVLLYQMAVRGKFLARTWSNHVDDFLMRVGANRIERYNQYAPFLKTGGVLTLKLGTQTYTIKASHKLPGKSYLNPVHSAVRDNRMSEDADVTCDGHTHDGPAVMKYAYKGRWCWAIKTGTYKTQDTGHGSRWYSGQPMSDQVGLVFYPHTHRVEAFVGLETAVLHRNAVAEALKKAA